MSTDHEKSGHRRTRLLAALGFGCATMALVTSCATPTPYQPVGESYGYQDQQIESGRYQVQFSGNSLTKRETVENYLLYRAAEITIQTGNDYFVVVERDTDKETNYRTSYPFYPRGHFFYSLHYHGSGFGAGYGAGYEDGYTRAYTRYTASADILTFPGEKPGDDPKAYNAGEVVQNLGPLIVRPEDLAG